LQGGARVGETVIRMWLLEGLISGNHERYRIDAQKGSHYATIITKDGQQM
jgi:hypothetical protein